MYFSAMPHILLCIMGFSISLIFIGLAFALLSSFLIHNKNKAYIWIALMMLGGFYGLARISPLFPALGIVALLLYGIFSFLTYLTVKKKKET